MKLGSETETIEYKKTTGELKQGVISIAAILNKHNGGELYFGVKNDGFVSGQDISDKTLRDVSQAIANHIEPRIFPDISNVVIHNRDCIRVAFEGDDAPYFAYGRAYLRVADEDRVMSPQELESYILKKNSNRAAWDSETSNKTVDDVNEEILKDYIGKANTAGRIGYAYTDKRDILKRLDLLTGDKLTNAAQVMFCDNTSLEIQMAVFASNERLTFIDIDRKSGTVTELVKIGEDYIKDKMRWRVEFDGSIQRKEIPEIPIDAIREALVNSYCHKNFTVSQSNEIAIFKNRIEIYNPGKFPDGALPQDFIDGEERSIRRNPLLAQTLYYSKDIEKFGTGLRRIANACKEADVRVEFKVLKMGFAVVFYREEKVVDYLGRVVREKATAIPDKATDITDMPTDMSDIPTDMSDIMSDIPEKATDMSDILCMSDIDSKETIVVNHLKINAFVTNRIVCELLSISTATARRLLQSMVKKGLIVAEGENKGRRYKLR